jgi:hypothetical protein
LAVVDVSEIELGVGWELVYMRRHILVSCRRGCGVKCDGGRYDSVGSVCTTKRFGGVREVEAYIEYTAGFTSRRMQSYDHVLSSSPDM